MSEFNLIEDVHYYYDETGLIVFTKEYHLQRGFCCGNGCKHCPYNYANVANEKEKEFLRKKNNDLTKIEIK